MSAGVGSPAARGGGDGREVHPGASGPSLALRAPSAPLLPSFFLGGFECSTHRRADGRRLDLVAGTGHDRHAAADYHRLRDRGLLAARDGARWHLIEPSPGRFDFASLVPVARAARGAGVVVVWDLFHYGWPDDLDIFAPEFPDRFARFAGTTAAVLADIAGAAPWVAPVNEISFLSWAGGEVGWLNPFARGRADDLKAQLVRAAIAGCAAVRAVAPGARLVHTDPLFHCAPATDDPADVAEAGAYRHSQFHAWDILGGRDHPEWGGRPEYLDVIGVNYYPWNQWVHAGKEAAGPQLAADDPRRRLFRDMLAEVHTRYGRPVLLAETGAEGDARAGWLREVCGEVAAARDLGVPVGGVCWYPVLDFPGWDNDRHCPSGLWGYADDGGGRPVDEALAAELGRQQAWVVV